MQMNEEVTNPNEMALAKPHHSYHQFIIDSIQEPILVIDRSFIVRDLNAAAALSLGKTKGELLGHACFKISHQMDSPCFEHGHTCAVRNAFTTGKQIRTVHHHEHKDGSQIWEEVIATPWKDDDGEVVFVIEELRDVTQLLKTREVVEHLTKEVKVLRGFLHTCASCRRVKNDTGEWEDMQIYIRNNSQADFSHDICPECMQRLYPEVPIHYEI